MNTLKTTDDWIDYYVNRIPDPFIINGKFKTYNFNNHYMGIKEYYRRLYKGLFNGDKEQGNKLFLDEMIKRSNWLFTHKIWSPKSFTRNYYQLNHELAPLCSGGCGKQVLQYSEWGERNPFHEMCSNCQKRLETRIVE